MAKTLNELASELKEYIINSQSDAHNKGSLRPERYNNLTLKMNIAQNPTPHVVITIAMSEAEFNIRNGEKVSGSMGPDERYVLRWMEKPNTLPNLNTCWSNAEKNRGRIADKY